jgi:hypothetical protein
VNLGWLSEYLRLPARVYAAIAVISGAILLAPERLLSVLGLDELRNDHRGWLGYALVAALALLVAALGQQLWLYLKAKAARRAAVAKAEATAKAESEAAEKAVEGKRGSIETLRWLASDEKLMLIPFIAENVRARRVPMNSAALKALIGAGILGQPEQVAYHDFAAGQYMVEVYIQPWAMEYLRQHRELLGLD